MEFPTEVNSVDVYWLGHATVRLESVDGFTIYIDPWHEVMQEAAERKADVIIATHDHDDHFDIKALQAIKKRDTIVVCTEESADDVPPDVYYDTLKPNRMVKAHGMQIRGIPAYNVNKFRSPDDPYHPEGFGLGVLFSLDGITFYHAGDTDVIEEMHDLADEDIEVAFLPVGGTYTMDQDEAINAVQLIQPDQVVPIHYGYLEETTADIDRFQKDVETLTDAEPLILERQTP